MESESSERSPLTPSPSPRRGEGSGTFAARIIWLSSSLIRSEARPRWSLWNRDRTREVGAMSETTGRDGVPTYGWSEARLRFGVFPTKRVCRAECVRSGCHYGSRRRTALSRIPKRGQAPALPKIPRGRWGMSSSKPRRAATRADRRVLSVDAAGLGISRRGRCRAASPDRRRRRRPIGLRRRLPKMPSKSARETRCESTPAR